MKKVKLCKFQDDQKIESIKFETFQEVSNFIWNELKGMKKFNFSYSSNKNWLGETITHLKLKDSNIMYIVKSKNYLLRKNIFKIGDDFMTGFSMPPQAEISSSYS